MAPMTNASPRPFRVIIVGGGPAGLCLAHALAGAGIDYVLLERRDTVVQRSGLGLALWPHGVRILDQLGLFEEALGIRILDKYNYLPDGAEICHTDLYDDIEQKCVFPCPLPPLSLLALLIPLIQNLMPACSRADPSACLSRAAMATPGPSSSDRSSSISSIAAFLRTTPEFFTTRTSSPSKGSQKMPASASAVRTVTPSRAPS
jgi:hypothetical protein